MAYCLIAKMSQGIHAYFFQLYTQIRRLIGQYTNLVTTVSLHVKYLQIEFFTFLVRGFYYRLYGNLSILHAKKQIHD